MPNVLKKTFYLSIFFAVLLNVANLNKSFADAIENVTNVSYKISQAGIDISWEKPSDPKFDHAEIYRNGTWIGIGSLMFWDTNVENNTTYRYEIISLDKLGNKSSGASISVTMGNIKPPKDVSLQTAPEVTNNTVSFYWTKPSVPDIAAISIYRDGNLIAETQNSSFKDTNLTPNTTYVYQIKTKDHKGIESVGLIRKITTLANSDIKGHWAEQNILDLKTAGFITGYPDGTFHPDEFITRAEVAAAIVKAGDLVQNDLPDVVILKYVDKEFIPEWAQWAIADVTLNKMMTGYEDNTFRPNQFITRQEAIVVLSKCNCITEFPDRTIFNFEKIYADYSMVSIWAQHSVDFLYRNRMLSGYEDSEGKRYLKPLNNITRAEFFTLLHRCKKLFGIYQSS